jgi:hypothetical protein
MSARPPSTLEGLSRTSARLFDDCLLPTETLKIRYEARQFAERLLAPRGEIVKTCGSTVFGVAGSWQ